MGMQRVRVTAEERNCQEGVHTMRRPERQDKSQREGYDRLLAVGNLSWLGRVISEELEEEAA